MNKPLLSCVIVILVLSAAFSHADEINGLRRDRQTTLQQEVAHITEQPGLLASFLIPDQGYEKLFCVFSQEDRQILQIFKRSSSQEQWDMEASSETLLPRNYLNPSIYAEDYTTVWITYYVSGEQPMEGERAMLDFLLETDGRGTWMVKRISTYRYLGDLLYQCHSYEADEDSLSSYRVHMSISPFEIPIKERVKRLSKRIERFDLDSFAQGYMPSIYSPFAIPETSWVVSE